MILQRPNYEYSPRCHAASKVQVLLRSGEKLRSKVRDSLDGTYVPKYFRVESVHLNLKLSFKFNFEGDQFCLRFGEVDFQIGQCSIQVKFPLRLGRNTDGLVRKKSISSTYTTTSVELLLRLHQ